jgi:C4-dicarboxylate transporter/malic acid transport protein
MPQHGLPDLETASRGLPLDPGVSVSSSRFQPDDGRSNPSHNVDGNKNFDTTRTTSDIPLSRARAATHGSNRLRPSRTQRFRAELRRITLHFTPSWFSVNMGTGISSILLHQLPYQFHGLGIISNIIFGFNAALFLVFVGLSLARYLRWPQLVKIMLHHPSQSLFLGTFAMGFATIINMCALSAIPAWGPGSFVTFTWALWWIDAIISLLICIGLPFLQFTRHTQTLNQVSGVWFLPVVSTIVASATGGLVAEHLPPSRAKLTLTVCWILWGTGFGLAFLLMALYYARQAIHKIPPAQLIVSTFLPLGPCGQGAFALLQLSSVLYKLSKDTDSALGSTATTPDAEVAHMMATAIYAVTVPMALVIWGLGLVWLSLAVSSLIDLWLVSKLQFNLGWWGFTFPLGVFAVATIKLASELDSGAFRVLATILSLSEVLLWAFIAGFTLVKAIQGEIFFSPCLAELCDEHGEPLKAVPAARKYAYQPRQIANTFDGKACTNC